MRRVTGLAIVAGAVALAVMIGERMSSDAMAVAVGVVFGVAASIPTSLLVVAATRGRRDDGYRRRNELTPPPPPPQIYVVNPGAPSSQGAVPWLSGAVQGQWPGVPGAPPALYAAGQPPRRFKVVGDAEHWLEESGPDIIDM